MSESNSICTCAVAPHNFCPAHRAPMPPAESGAAAPSVPPEGEARVWDRAFELVCRALTKESPDESNPGIESRASKLLDDLAMAGLLPTGAELRRAHTFRWRVRALAKFIERDRREPDKVLAYALELQAAALDASRSGASGERTEDDGS